MDSFLKKKSFKQRKTVELREIGKKIYYLPSVFDRGSGVQ